MLRRIAIRDFVIVDQLELGFDAGFAVLTGETGAGKSILVDALAFLLGERADAALVRPGAAKAEVAAEFDLADLPEVTALLVAQDIEVDGELLIRRVLEAGGRSRAYLNGSPATVQQLREVTDHLADIHGQHAHQSLLRPDTQRALVDAYGDLAALLARVTVAWRDWQAAQTRWQAALGQGEAVAAERERLGDEVAALKALAFSPDEWVSLDQEQRRLAHAVSLVEGAQWVVDALAENDGACTSTLAAAAGRLDALTDFDDALQEPLALVRSAEAELHEAASTLRRYADRLDVDPARLAEVDARIDAVMVCARRYRVEIDDLPARLAASREALAALDSSADPQALEREAKSRRAVYDGLAAELTAARTAAAERLAAAVTARMQALALGGGRFMVTLSAIDEGSASGNERIEFQLSGLAGDTPRPLAKVASGGELSRISLALQLEASQSASIPTLVFDEVDVGIGGGVAEIVGKLLRDLGATRQVLCVTHLPQVAAQANRQWQVSKAVDSEGGVISRVHLLADGQRIEEIARMLGGVELTETTRAHAREMLGFA
jgi:DNA repair protein RecN (Recombination protein N)